MIDLATALATIVRAKATGGECRAGVWFKRQGTGEWYEWDTCNREPGHDGPHQIWSDRYSDSWGDWSDGDGGAWDWSHCRYIQVEEFMAKPSPWTAAELEAWARAGKGSE